MTDAIRVTVDFGSYNQRRYSAPWIARVTSWPVGGSSELKFGGYLGDRNNGTGGQAEILAYVGDVVRWGQKDYRGHKSWSQWGLVEEGGYVRKITPVEARSLFLDRSENS